MPQYFYTAKSLKGDPKSGTLEAKDTHQLASILRQEGYVLIDASLERLKKEKKSLKIPLSFFDRVKLTDKMMFTRNLKVMISAEIPLPRALKTLSNLVQSRKFRNALLKITEEIMQGKGFSESLAKHPNVFSELFVSMIKVGEESGTLEQVLTTLTNQMERENETNSKIVGALIYPIVIIIAMIGIGFLMLVMVIPKLAETFKELGVELPATTRFIIAMGNFSAQYWYLVPFIIVAFVMLFKRFLKTKIGRKFFDTFTIKAPIIAPIVKKANAAYTARTLSSLVSAGVPIVRSLEIISGTMGNSYYKAAITESIEGVRKGKKLSEILAKYENIYSSLLTQMLAIGEETGQTSDILSKLAGFYENEVTEATKNLSTVIEPLIMLLIGGVVGFFAISMVQPMYSMLGAM